MEWECCNEVTSPIKGIDYLSKADYDTMKEDIDLHFSGLMEVLAVSVTGNQTTSSDDLKGASISVVGADGKIISSATWEGSELLFNVKPGVEYRVHVDATGQKYNTFTSDIYIAMTGNRVVEAEVFTEKLVVNVTGVSGGFSVDISGYGEQTSVSGSYLVPYGTEYSVTPSHVKGYKTPSGITRTANSSTYTLTVEYTANLGELSPGNGVYIKDIDGYYHTAVSWTDGYVPSCIAVISDEDSFGIALHEESLPVYIDAYHEIHGYMTWVEDETSAKSNYSGAGNTSLMRSHIGSNGSYAQGWCSAYPFPGGENGFLPSSGQWWLAYCNKAAVNEAMAAAGGDAIGEVGYRSSTMYGLNVDTVYFWMMYWSTGSLSTCMMHPSISTRPFCSLELP